MNKGELVDSIYRNSDCTKQECRELVNQIVDVITEKVAKGEEVRLVNFGTFKPNPRKSTVKRHPQTGEKIDVPSKVTPKFSPGKGFNEKVQNNLKATNDGEGFRRK
ncbi:HU family DNA-binding protein [Candidatus Bipolaricaulota bacterium]|nr:HU family DNA-binding protein [Candidatus Bipolaricaulota bacterium]MBS3825885.1 HU family DNA-binding protein [Candidatus Bipolaricaulota bacterium]